jgi:CubicO group peptidase (beta-lactamase class C family)
MNMKSLGILTAIVLLHLACSDRFLDDNPYRAPQDLNDGLEAGTLEEVGIDSQLVFKASARIRKGRYGEVHSMLIYKDNRLVFEEYYKGHDYQWDAPKHYGDLVNWNATMPHYAHSVSKSITSMCVGIAVDQGLIRDVHQSIFDYLPGYEYLQTEENKYITIEHLLTGTSGLLWAEWSAPLSSMDNDQIAIWFHDKGPVDFVLSRPMIAPPGTYFTYSGGNIEILGVILENASGMPFEDFSRKYLFDPLGLDSAYWGIIYNTGEVHAAAGLLVTPREMVKIGATMLNNGFWDGKEILSDNWVTKSAYPYAGNVGINVPGEDLKDMGYSYTWWTREIPYHGRTIHWFSANGWGGQKIIVLPELDAVVVFTGANYTSKVKQYAIFEDYLLPALDQAR